MNLFDTGVYKTDGHAARRATDTCPTCSTELRTTARVTAHSHQYRLTCPACTWQIDLERPTESPRVLPDGGTIATTPTPERTARDVLDELHFDESVARLCKHLETGTSNVSGEDIKKTLALAEGELALEIELRNKIEYVSLDEEWRDFEYVTVHTDGKVWRGTLSTEDLEFRLSKPMRVIRRATVPETFESEL